MNQHTCKLPPQRELCFGTLILPEWDSSEDVVIQIIIL